MLPLILSIFGLNEILLIPYYGFLLYNINYFQAWLASHSTPQASDIKPFPQEEPIERSLSLKPFFKKIKHVSSPRLTLSSRLPLPMV